MSEIMTLQIVDYSTFYKGIPVIKQDFLGGSMSFGAIFLEKSLKHNDVGRNTVKHEYGHNVQLAQMGPGNYFLGIAIPSVTFAVFDPFKDNYKNYYKRPWEAMADFYGGVER